MTTTDDFLKSLFDDFTVAFATWLLESPVGWANVLLLAHHSDP